MPQFCWNRSELRSPGGTPQADVPARSAHGQTCAVRTYGDAGVVGFVVPPRVGCGTGVGEKDPDAFTRERGGNETVLRAESHPRVGRGDAGRHGDGPPAFPKANRTVRSGRRQHFSNRTPCQSAGSSKISSKAIGEGKSGVGMVISCVPCGLPARWCSCLRQMGDRHCIPADSGVAPRKPLSLTGRRCNTRRELS